jgi:carbamoyltransferase
LCIDGIGEFDTTSLAACRGGELRVLEQVEYPNSLGFVWEVITSFLGYRSNIEEGTVMGLAAYGDPSVFMSAFDSLISVDADGSFTADLTGQVGPGNLASLEALFGMPRRLPYEPVAWQGRNRRHADLAAALQAKTNQVFLHLAERAKGLTGLDRLVIAGGVGLNCVATGVVAESGLFRDLYVQPASGDAGTAVGAALFLAAEQDHVAADPMMTPFLGPDFSDNECESALKRHRLDYRRVDDPIGEAVELIERGLVVGWFQGRMEFGPRALGNRSLLANPTLAGVRHVMNLQVKHREDFRPFCPTILEAHADEWLDYDEEMCAASRWMLATYPVRRQARERIPAVIHLDGSCRPQILREVDNPLFFELVERFHERTGVPMVLNTSFNDREPIVCSPDDACACFLKTRFDAMVMGPFLVTGLKPWERRTTLGAFETEAARFDAAEGSE